MTTTARGDGRRVSRRVVDPPYLPWHRWSDARAGRRAGRAGLTQPAASPWLLGMESTCRENDLRQFARTADRLAPDVARVRLLVDRIRQLDSAIVEGTELLAVVPAPVLAKVTAGEAHLSDTDVATRRTREHAAQVDEARGRLARLRADRQGACTAAIEAAAALAEEYALLQATSQRLRWHYTRRISTYLRALTRRGAEIATTAWALPPSPWADLPCPWIPAELDELATSRKETDDAVLAA